MKFNLACLLLLVFETLLVLAIGSVKAANGIGNTTSLQQKQEQQRFETYQTSNPLPVSLSHLSKSLKISKFVSKLVRNSYKHCKLLLLHDGIDGGGHNQYQNQDSKSDIFKDIAQRTELSYYNVVFPSRSREKPLLPESQIDALTATQNTSSTTTKNADTLKTKNHKHDAEGLPIFTPSINHHNRHSGHCTVVVLLIDDIRGEFLQRLFHMLTPVYIPITRKDEDYYIFITQGRHAEELLLREELPAKIKFKISVSVSHEEESDPEKSASGSLLVQTVCFFCTDGEPKIIQLPGDLSVFLEEADVDVDYFPDFVMNLQRKTLRVSVPAMESRIEVRKPYKGINNAERGLWKNLLEDFLGVKYNFTYTMFVSTGKDGNFGGGGTGLQLKNGTWIGVVGDLYYGKADLGVLASKTPTRIYFMDTSDSFFDVTYLTFVTSKADEIFTPATLFWPFDTLMWILIISSTLLAFVIFKLILHSITSLGLSSSSSSATNTSNLSFARRGILSTSHWGLRHQIQFILTAFLEQDCVLPISQPLRCFVALWLCFALVITSVYRSKLVTLLAFPELLPIPKTFPQLAFSDFEVGFMKHGDSAYNTLAASNDPVYVKLIKEMEVVTGVGLDCLEKVVQKRYACIAYEFSLTYLKSRNLSDGDIMKLVFAPDHTYNIWTGLNFQGRSIYKRNFDRWLRLTRPMHLADIWERDDMNYNVRKGKRQWWNETGQWEKFKLGGDQSKSLTIKHAVGAFTALFVGLVGSGFGFLGEFLCFKFKRRFSSRLRGKAKCKRGDFGTGTGFKKVLKIDNINIRIVKP